MNKSNKLLIKFCCALPLVSMAFFAVSCGPNSPTSGTYKVDLQLKGQPSQIKLSNENFKLFTAYETALENVDFSDYLDLKVLINNQPLKRNKDYTYNEQTCILNVKKDVMTSTNFVIEITVSKSSDAVPSFCLDIDDETLELRGFKHDVQISSYTILRIPEKIKKIKRQAFANAFSDTSGLSISRVIFNENLDNIGDYAFYNCSKLIGSLELPPKLLKIGAHAFEKTSYTGELKFPENLTDIGYAAFFDTQFSGGLTFPSKLTNIGAFAFSNCKNLDGNIVFSDSIANLGSGIFANCPKIQWNSVSNYPKELKYIPAGLFTGCEKLATEITIPEEIETIGEGAFRLCPSIETIHFNKNLTKIEGNAFEKCANLVTLDSFGEKIDTIGPSAFEEDAKLDCDIALPEVTSISSNCFAKCAGWSKKIILGEKIVNIGNRCFYQCKNLKEINKFPSSLQFIGDEAFSGCGALNVNQDEDKKTFTASADLRKLGKQAFYDCKALNLKVDLTSVQPQNFELGESAFEESNINGLILPSNLQKIPVALMKNCKNIDDVVISNNVIEIGDSAFEGCSNLKAVVSHISLTFPSHVTRFGNNSFYGCKEVRSVREGTVANLFMLGEDVTTIGDNAFNGSNFSDSDVNAISINCNVIRIGEHAFAN